MTRTRKSGVNFLSGLILSTLTMLVGLAATPWILSMLGAERFGAFRAASDWTSHLLLLELGLGGALLPLLAQAHGQGPQAVCDTLAAGIWAYIRVVLAVVVGGAVLAASITWLVPVHSELIKDLQYGCWIGIAPQLLLPLAPFTALALAEQRTYVVHALLLMQSLLTTVASLASAIAGWGIAGQFLAVLAGGVPAPLILTWRACRRYPELGASFLHPTSHASCRQHLWRLNWPTLALGLCGRVSLLTGNIIIAYMLGAVAVAPFFMTQRLASLAHAQLQGLGNASWAGLAELHISGRGDVFNERLLQLTRLTVLLGVSCAVPISAYNRYFIGLWLGPDQYGGDAVTVLAGLLCLIQSVLSLWGWAFTGTGQVARVVPMAIVSMVVNLIVSVWATHIFGLSGPLLGTCVSMLAVNVCWYAVLLRDVFGICVARLARSTLPPLALGIPFAGLVWSLSRIYEPAGWAGLSAAMGCCCLAFLAAYELLAWNSPESQLLRQQIVTAFLIHRQAGTCSEELGEQKRAEFNAP